MTDIEVIENLEALAALTGDNEGILRAAIDHITSLEQGVKTIGDGSFEGASPLAVEGKWQEFATKLQFIAQALLKANRDTSPAPVENGLVKELSWLKNNLNHVILVSGEKERLRRAIEEAAATITRLEQEKRKLAELIKNYGCGSEHVYSCNPDISDMRDRLKGVKP